MTLTLFFGFPVLLFIYLLRCSLPSSINVKVIAFSRFSEFTTVEIPYMLVQWLHALMKTQNQRRLSWHFHTCNHTVKSWLSGLIKSDILLGCFDPFNSTGESGSLEARKTQYWPNDLQDICQVFFPKFMAGIRVPVTCCHSSQLMFEQFDQYLITPVNMYSVLATD